MRKSILSLSALAAMSESLGNMSLDQPIRVDLSKVSKPAFFTKKKYKKRKRRLEMTKASRKNNR